MSEHPNKACQETGTGGKVCWLVLGHPGRVHVDVTDGGLVVWSPADGEKFRNVPLNTEDPARDAPEALKAKRCGHILPCNCTILFPGDVPADEQQCASQHPRNQALFCARSVGHEGEHCTWRSHNHVVSWPRLRPAPGDKAWLEVEPQVPLRGPFPAAECGAANPNGTVNCTLSPGHGGAHHNQNNGVSWYPQVLLCQEWSPSGQYLCTEPFGHDGQHRRDNGGVNPIVWARS